MALVPKPPGPVTITGDLSVGGTTRTSFSAGTTDGTGRVEVQTPDRLDPNPPFISATVQGISEAVQAEQEAAVGPNAHITFENLAKMVTVGVLRALEEVHKKGGLAKTLNRIEAERQKANCKTDLIGERVGAQGKEEDDDDDNPQW